MVNENWLEVFLIKFGECVSIVIKLKKGRDRELNKHMELCRICFIIPLREEFP